jgi:hypothetical protein
MKNTPEGPAAAEQTFSAAPPGLRRLFQIRMADMILDWPKMYKEKLTDAHTALAKIRRGARIFIASACGEPQLLVQTLLDMARMFADVEIIHFLDLGLTDYTSDIYTAHFRHNALFIGENARAAIQAGRADYTPIFLSEVAPAHAARVHAHRRRAHHRFSAGHERLRQSGNFRGHHQNGGRRRQATWWPKSTRTCPGRWATVLCT